jgi:ComF family protein
MIFDRKPDAGEPARGRLLNACRRNALRLFADSADLLLPRACAGCDCLLQPRELGFCNPCFEQLPGRTAARCPVCGVRHAAAADTCDDCRRRPPNFNRVVVLADYAPPVDHLIAALKFRRQLSLARALGEALARTPIAGSDEGAGAPASVPTMITPVPLSRMRLLERGFNQSQLIARALARRLAMAPPRPLLRRCRETAPQAGLHWNDRQKNLRGAFDCQAAVDGCIVWLVDDVMTTGATLDASAIALKRSGAVSVVGIVAARTPLPSTGVLRAIADA